MDHDLSLDDVFGVQNSKGRPQIVASFAIVARDFTFATVSLERKNPSLISHGGTVVTSFISPLYKFLSRRMQNVEN